MAKHTKAERSAVARKAAATRKQNEAKDNGDDLRRAARRAARAARDLGVAAAGAAKSNTGSLSKG